MSPRGQTLVLFALTLLFLTVGVLVTLEVGSRTRERVEAQMTADAAAYSEAVATARAFNQVALLNRMSISVMVSMAATQSYISWSGAVRGAVNNPPPGCVAPPLQGSWEDADYAAGIQVQVDQGSAGVAAEQTLVLDALVDTLLAQQRQAGALAAQVDDGLEASAAAANPGIQMINRLLPKGQYGRGTDVSSKDAVYATMGSRGDPWVTNRGGGGGGSGFGDPDPSMGEGVAGYSDARHRAQTLQANGTVSWADDDNGTINMTCRGVPNVGVPVRAAYVASSALQYPDDQHYYDGSKETSVKGQPVSLVHTLGKCARCPGIWPFFSDFTPSEVSAPGELFGQPLLMAVVDRDYLRFDPAHDVSAALRRPWNLGFHFDVLGRASVDNASRAGKMASDDMFRHQVAVATAVAYYHRKNGNGYREPANVFNPFWRATLVSGAVRAGGPWREDNMVSSAGFPAHAAVLGGLERWGFGGY